MSITKIARVIRRQLPGGWIVAIGPHGISLKEKRKAETFPLPWREIIHRAQYLAIAKEAPAEDPPDDIMKTQEALFR